MKIGSLIVLNLLSFFVFGQADCDMLSENSFQCNWKFFQLPVITNGVVISYQKAPVSCGVYTAAALSIIETTEDTIRVISLCEDSNFVVGQNVQIIPNETPNYRVTIPFYLALLDVQQGETIYRSNEYDEVTLKTTWGKIE